MRPGTWVLIATILGSSMVFIDGSVVSVALPVMQRDLHGSAAQAQWIVEAYMIVLGALMLLGGAIGDRYGRKRTFAIGIVVFVLASVWCGAAGTIDHAILARVMQGIGGMLMAPASLAIIAACFVGAERDKAIGTWSMFTALTTMLSPVLGGALVTGFGWRAVFYLNVPIGILTAFATFRHVPETRDEDERGLPDIVGSILIAGGLGALVYSLTELSGQGGSLPKIAGVAALGCGLLLAFLFVERRLRDPIMPLSLFASPIFSGVNLATLLLYGGLSAMFYFVPFDLIQAHGYSPAKAGLALLPFVIPLSLLSRYSATILTRTGPRFVLTAGIAIVVAGFVMFAMLPRECYWCGVFPPIFTIGIGMGFVVAPLTATVMNSVPEQHVGLASGINNAVSRIGGLLAIAMAGAVIWSAFNARLNPQLDAIHATAGERATVNAQRVRLAGGRYADARLRSAVLGSYDAAFNDVALLCAGLAAAASLASFFMLASASPQRVSPQPSRSVP
jgi:EmrB/QacA subfamily drug resistance transporter